MRKIFYIGLFLGMVMWQQANGQTYELLNVDASRFPIIQANIAVMGAGYVPGMLTVKDISITDAGTPKVPLEFLAPRSVLVPASMVLALDISGSMDGQRFDILKQTTLDFIKMLPLEITEVAIVSFNDKTTLVCDFTHDANRLNRSVENLIPHGGTDFQLAFLNEFSGAIPVARQGKYHREVIFITDGLSVADYSLVVQKAIRDSIRIHCITVGLPMEEDLQWVTRETGGNSYSDLNSKEEIGEALQKIYNALQERTFGMVRWRSDYSCSAEKKAEVKLADQVFEVVYQIPDSLVGSIDLVPETVSFGLGSVGQTQVKPVFIRGNNIALNLTSITNTLPTLFGFSGKLIPILAGPNQWEQLNLTYTPTDTIFTLTDFTISQPGCPDKIVDVSTQGLKKLVITSPQGGEEYYRGSLVPITWRGIDKSTPVVFYYQLKGEKKLHKATTGYNYSKEWLAAPLNDSIRIIGQVTNNLTLANIMSAPNTLFDGSEFKSAVYNSDGTEVLTQTVQGAMKNWDAISGKINNNFEKPVAGKAAFFEKYNRVVSVTKNNISLFTNRNGLFIRDVSIMDKRTLASFVFVGDQEFYTSSATYSGNMWDPTLNMNTGELPGGVSLDAAFSANGAYVVSRKKNELLVYGLIPRRKWLAIDLEPEFENTVLHASRNLMSVNYRTQTELYFFNAKYSVVVLQNQHFVQFSRSGNRLVTSDSLRYLFYDLDHQKTLYTIPKDVEYTLSPDGRFLATYRNQQLRIYHISDSLLALQQTIPQLKQFRFFPASKKLALLTADSLRVLNLENGQMEAGVSCEPGLVQTVEVAPNEKSMAVVTNKAVALWPITNFFDSDTTPYFKIVSPTPWVKKQLDFPNQRVGIAIEKVFVQVVQNKYEYSLIIDSLFVEDSNSPFSLVSSAGPIAIPPGGSHPVELRFTPQKAGTTEGELIILSSEHRLHSRLVGTGVEAGFELLTPVCEFSPLDVGSKADTLIPLIRNSGNIPISIGIPMLSLGNSFKLTVPKKQVTINPGDTLQIVAEFYAQVRGRTTDHIYLTIDNKEAVLACELQGTALAKRELVIAGYTLHAGTQKPLNSMVTASELNSSRVVIKKGSDKRGYFAFKVDADLNYSVAAEKEGYFSSSENIDLVMPQTLDTLWVQLYLTPFAAETNVRLNNIFFESGLAVLLDISKSELSRLVQLMKKEPRLAIQVHGHTDDIGTPDDNKVLSKKRAHAVKEFLVSEGIAEQRILVNYFGETQPLAANQTEEGRKANRRVEIRFGKP